MRSGAENIDLSGYRWYFKAPREYPDSAFSSWVWYKHCGVERGKCSEEAAVGPRASAIRGVGLLASGDGLKCRVQAVLTEERGAGWWSCA